MATTAGAISKLSAGKTTASVSSAVATGAATTPVLYQWYRSTVSGFTPGTGNVIAGATALLLNDTGLSSQTQYYYKMVATDSSAPAVSSVSSQLGLATLAPDVNPNQFAQIAILGMVDMYLNYNTIPVQIDSSEAGSLLPGQAVKIVDSAGGVPKVIACSANADAVFGFINFNIKNRVFVAGDPCEISQNGNVMYLQSTSAIARGAQVQLDVFSVGGVAQVVGASGARIVGTALDKANGGQLLRVEINVLGAAVSS